MSPDQTEELQALRQSVARFASERIAPFAQEWDRKEGYPDDLVRHLAAQGLWGIRIDEAYGGAGGDYAMFAVVLEELARHDGGVALAVEAHNGLCCEHIALAGSDSIKQRFLPSLARGDVLGSWCLSEPDSGTDAAGMKTRAVRDGDTWVLNGTKQFITNGHRAGLFVVTAVTSAEGGRKGISAFVVERDTPGLETGALEDKLGMRSSDTVTVSLSDVRVPDDQRLGAVDGAFDDVKVILAQGRVMISALCLGLARGALEESVRYAEERHAFGQPIANYQLIQAKVADMAIQLEAARALVRGAVERLDRGESVAYESAVTKVFASEMATAACLQAIQVHGGYGYLKDYNVERYLRDAKLCEIGEGTSEILRILVARGLFARMGRSESTQVGKATR